MVIRGTNSLELVGYGQHYGLALSADNNVLSVASGLKHFNDGRANFIYSSGSVQELNLNDASSWDTTSGTDYTTASNRAGVDFYIYLVKSGSTFSIKVSASNSAPTGYSLYTLIGGFHGLCVAVGTIAGHTLSGYAQGDILPASCWYSQHRPVCSPKGMVFVSGIRKWMDIYLPSWNGSKLVSEYGGTIAGGASAKKFHWYKFTEEFGKIGKRLSFQQEFIPAAKGSPEGTNISGSADPGTTGGHSDTASRRIISNYGCEDMTGVLWQWGADGGATNDVGSAWVNAYDSDAASDNSEATGQHYEAPNRPLFGGDWGSGARCGPRGSGWYSSPLALGASYSARGVAEPYRIDESYLL